MYQIYIYHDILYDDDEFGTHLHRRVYKQYIYIYIVSFTSSSSCFVVITVLYISYKQFNKEKI